MKRSLFGVLFVSIFLAKGLAGDIKIISSSAASLRIKYTPSFTDSSLVKENSTDYLRLMVKDGSLYYSISGMPRIPVIKIPVGVPDFQGNNITVLNVTRTSIRGKLIPVAKVTKNGTEPAFDYKEGAEYSKDESFPGSLANFSDSGIVRGVKFLTLSLNPVQYNPVTENVTYITSIELQINFRNGSSGAVKPSDPLLTGLFVNYNAAKNWASNSASLSKANKASVLSTGKWFKFTAPEEGMYKITREKLVSLGFDPSVMDPRTIKIYNNGGQMLPEDPTAARPADLVENAIFVEGEADGKLDDNDYVLFYGRGIGFWQYDSNSKNIQRNRTPYSFENYYWINWDDKSIANGGTAGKRMTLQDGGLKLSTADSVTTTNAYLYREDEKINIGKTGRDFFGDDFSSTMKQRTYPNVLEGYLNSKPVIFRSRFINSASSNVLLNIYINQTLNLSYLTGGASSYTIGVADERSAYINGPFTNNRADIKFSYEIGNSGEYGYLDYYELIYLRDLKAYSGSLLFFTPSSFSAASGKTVQYNLSEFASSDIRVFNVSDNFNVKLISNPIYKGTSTYGFQTTESAPYSSKYLALNPASFKTPGGFTQVANQNLHGFTSGVQHVIIAASKFQAQAERLRNYRTTARYPLSSKVFLVDDIYNEFGCGQKDPSAIRDFLRFAYLNWTIKPQYVLLFGDGDYDFRNIEQYGNNYIPTYQTYESLDEISSYCIEDYFVSVDGNDLFPDIGLGRLTVQTDAEAAVAVDKIIHYETNSSKNLWRNRVTLVADDGFTSKGSDGPTYTRHCEELAEMFPENIESNKVYLADFPAVSTSWGRRKPEVNKAIINSVNDGTLILNFIGHGSPEVWAYQEVFNKDVSIPLLNNSNYCFLTTGTCSFGYFDKTFGHSGAEMFVLAENKGAIGALSTVRPVYADGNLDFLKRFFGRLFLSVPDTMNLIPRMGQAYLSAKFQNYENDQKYNLLGDPAIRLEYPQYTGLIDSLNGKAVSSVVQVKALSKVKLSGMVMSNDTTVYSGYNGSALVSVYDSDVERSLPYYNNEFSIIVQGGLLFRGLVDVKNGRYETEFTVPKDISYADKQGKIVVYYYNTSNDGVAICRDIRVGGTDTTQVNDGNGPIVDITFGSLAQMGDYVVKPDESLIVKLSDETGLNTTGSGIGHKIQAVLNDDESNSIDLSNYFTADAGSAGKSGIAEYKLVNIPEGEYKIEVRAFDVFNNKGVGTSKFKVVALNDSYLSKVYNFPNPFKSSTTFIIDQAIAGKVNLSIKIFSPAGRMIKEISKRGISAGHILIPWDGNDNDGNTIANGVYLYKVIVKPEAGGKVNSCIGKLSIIR